MNKIDTCITRLNETVAALEKARSSAIAAELPPDEVIALEQMESALRATVDRVYNIAFRRGTEAPVRLVKRLKLDPGKMKGRRK